jgi:tryptophan synthase alpha chain
MSSGLERISAAFAAPGALFMPYMTLGFPDYDASLDVIASCAENGAGLMELGIPFSDPLADGPTVQHSTQAALEGGMTVGRSLQAVRDLRRRGVTIPFVLMSYYNPVLAYGLEKFASEAAAAGADGLLFPDLPPEEAGELTSLAQQNGLALSFMLSPNSTSERIRLATGAATGFVYLVSVLGITGARDQLPPGLADFIHRVRKQTAKDLPLAVGFGISTPEQAALVGQAADGVIIGSALVKIVDSSQKNRKDLLDSVGHFVAEIRKKMG